MINLRDDILKNQIAYYNGLIAKHSQNVEIYLNQPVGIGEHSDVMGTIDGEINACLLYTSPSPRDKRQSRMPSSA